MFISRKNRTLFVALWKYEYQLQRLQNENLYRKEHTHKKDTQVLSWCQIWLSSDWFFFSISPPLNFERSPLPNIFCLLKTGPCKWSKNRADDCDGADEVLVMLILMISIEKLIGIFILRNWLQKRDKKRIRVK